MGPALDDKRRGPDRRRNARGGRRPDDPAGFSPLIMLVGREPEIVTLAEAVLAKLRFAVATIGGVEQALTILATLPAKLIVAGADDAKRIRSEAPGFQVLEVTDEMRQDPMAVVGAVRRLLTPDGALVERSSAATRT